MLKPTFDWSVDWSNASGTVRPCADGLAHPLVMASTMAAVTDSLWEVVAF